MASQMSDAKYETTTVTLAVDRRTAARSEFTASGTVYTFRGFLDAYEEGHDEKRSDADKADDQSLPALAVGDVAASQGGRAEGPLDEPQAPLHRGEPRQGARGEGHRPPVDVREHHRRDPQPRVRQQARPGAHPELARVQRRAAARGALRRPRRLRLHGGARGRPRRDRPRRAEARGLAEGLLLRLRRPGRPAQHRRQPRRDRRARARTPRRSGMSRRCGSASTGRTSRSPTPRTRRATRVA